MSTRLHNTILENTSGVSCTTPQKSNFLSLTMFPLGDLDQFVFLVGSGISVPSGLPTAWDFNNAIARLLATKRDEEDENLSLVVSDYSAADQSIRFEQLMFILRERIDPQLEILRCFDCGSAPTMLHNFLVYAINRNSYVFTTNFDSLIEIAIGVHHSHPSGSLSQIYLEDEAEEHDDFSCRSFERYFRLNLPQPAILKLHGTLRDIELDRDPFQLSGLESVGATLDRIGSRSAVARLEPYKDATLRKALQGRILCVFGYSGSDDFDVIPSLSESLSFARGLIWIRHDNTTPVLLDAKTVDGAMLLPEQLRASAASISSFVIQGVTVEVIRDLFGYMPHGVADGVSPINVAALLDSLIPYKGLKPWTKKIIAGRISEEALRFDLAVLRYNDAVGLACRKDSSSYAFALFRLGHIERVLGNIGRAYSLLRRSLKIYRRLNDLRSISLVTNAIGNIFLDRGILWKAEEYYKIALAESSRSHFNRLEGVVLNNIGLVYKRRGEYEKAIEFYDKAISVDTMHREKMGLCREIGNKAGTLMLLGRDIEAAIMLDELVNIQRLLGRRELVAVTLANRGILYRRIGKFDEAERAAYEALNIEKNIGRIEGIARCVSLLAGIAAGRGKWNRAIKQYRNAVSMQRSLHRNEGIAVELENLGDCYASIEDYLSAGDAYEESGRYYSKLGNRQKAAELRRKAHHTKRYP